MKSFSFFDTHITDWMAEHGLMILRYSIGIIFVWFGTLKFFPGLSPAEYIATESITVLTFGMIPANVALWLLAAFEVTIGLLMLTARWTRLTIFLLLMQMLGALSPIVLFPEVVFRTVPFVLTLEGQYILKNLVVISAAIVIGATARGGRLTAEPKQ